MTRESIVKNASASIAPRPSKDTALSTLEEQARRIAHA
jgi:hypothetical protein